MAKAKQTTTAEMNPAGWLHAARHIGKQRGGWLVGHEGSYSFAVEAVAAILKPRFQSGELVPWGEHDDRWETLGPLSATPEARSPNSRLADECRRLFITSETSAFVVLTWASRRAARSAEWHDVMGDACSLPGAALDVVAGEAMAHDVAAYAKRQGWFPKRRKVAA
ncbi:MAG: hypothetical protein WB493_00405 [Anaeromyxobacteraceae bacterium]